MKKNILYIIISIVAITAFYFFVLKDNNTIAIEDDHQETQHDVVKSVMLNHAQVENAKIQFGTFSYKNLSEVIFANGYTKLPPQNIADVTVQLSGIVKKINVIEGEFVKEGQTIAVIESIEFTKLQQNYLESKSNLQWLSEEYERQKVLNTDQVNSKKVLQKAKNDYEVEKARFESLKKQMSILNLNANQEAISTMNIKAPISGYITDVLVNIGTAAQVDQKLFTIVDNSQMHVDLLVYEKDLSKVTKGQKVRFTLTNQGNQEILGEIFSVGKSFENETKSVAVHAEIFNDKQTLIPGMYVNALIDAGERKLKALPESAVVKADGKEFIFIKKEHSHEDSHASHDHDEVEFLRIEVKTGVAQMGFVQVNLLSKIDEHAEIVLNGVYYLQSHLMKSESGGHVH